MNCTTEFGTYPVDAPVTRFFEDTAEDFSVRFQAEWLDYDGWNCTEMASPEFTTLLQLRDYLIANSISPQSALLQLYWVDADNCTFGDTEIISPNPFA